MSKNRKDSAPLKEFSMAPLVTRGLRRQQAKTRRRREAVPSNALVVGINLARERQAISLLVSGSP